MPRQPYQNRPHYHDINRICKLYYAFLFHINAGFQISPVIKRPRDFNRISDPHLSMHFLKIRQKAFSNPLYIDRFVEANPFAFDQSDLSVIRGWRHAVAGRFFIYRHTREYSLFIYHSLKQTYGVKGLLIPLNEQFPKGRLPVLLDMLFLPYRDYIVDDSYHGLLGLPNEKESAMVTDAVKQLGPEAVCLMLPCGSRPLSEG